MMIRTSSWLLIAIAVAGTGLAQISKSPTSAQAATTAEEIKKLEHDRIQAGVRKDIAYVEAATADEYVQIDWDGKVFDKTATLARLLVKTEGLVARTPPGGPSVDEIMKLVISMQTIKRPSTPVAAANALSFLVSEDGGFITGQILHIDSGLSRSENLRPPA